MVCTSKPRPRYNAIIKIHIYAVYTYIHTHYILKIIHIRAQHWKPFKIRVLIFEFSAYICIRHRVTSKMQVCSVPTLINSSTYVGDIVYIGELNKSKLLKRARNL